MPLPAVLMVWGYLGYRKGVPIDLGAVPALYGSGARNCKNRHRHKPGSIGQSAYISQVENNALRYDFGDMPRALRARFSPRIHTQPGSAVHDGASQPKPIG